MNTFKIILLLLLTFPLLAIGDDDMKIVFEDRVQSIDDRGEMYWILFKTKSAVYRLQKKSKDIALLKELQASQTKDSLLKVQADMDTMELSLPPKK